MPNCPLSLNASRLQDRPGLDVSFSALARSRTALRTLDESAFQISRPFLSPSLIPSASVMKTSTLLLPFLTAVLSLVPSAHAHGFVASLGVDGKEYKGNVPGGTADRSAIRQVSEQDPIHGATNPTVNCGTGAPNADLVADAMPGSKLTFDWRTASLGAWPHDTGTFSISSTILLHVFNHPPRIPQVHSSPIWLLVGIRHATSSIQGPLIGSRSIKLARTAVGNGFRRNLVSSSHSSHTRLVSCLYTVDGDVYSTNLPKNLAPGQYLIRHEIIALHLATQKGGAEFYPSCQQINVGGSGTGGPTEDELLRFPGSYSDDDPGIFAPNVRCSYESIDSPSDL